MKIIHIGLLSIIVIDSLQFLNEHCDSDTILKSYWASAEGYVRAILKTVAAMLLLACAARASATETVTYTYDAKGRLIKVEKVGSVNNGVKVEYTHDKADNRTGVVTTGAP